MGRLEVAPDRGVRDRDLSRLWGALLLAFTVALPLFIEN